MPALITLFNIVSVLLSSGVRRDKEIKLIKIGKGKMLLSFTTVFTIMYSKIFISKRIWQSHYS